LLSLLTSLLPPQGDICSSDLVNYVLRTQNVDTIMNFAAQTHVDNSFGNSFTFTETNILGTHVLLEAAKTFGNAEEGKKVYETAGCIACHIPGAAQSKIGPDLSAISRGLPPELIVTEVVWPALNVKEGYEAATVTMKDGTVLTGFKQTETAEAIAVRDLATGVVKSIPKSETQAIQAGGTVMPDGLTAGMDERQLAHLVRYLMGLGAD
jgi:putative heme-binding domain-containing protein